MSITFYNPIDAEKKALLQSFFTEEKKAGGDVVVVRSCKLNDNKDIMTSSIVARAGVGTGNVPVKELQEKLIPVVYAPGGNADSVKEHTIGKMLDAAKNTFESTEYVKGNDDAPAAHEKIKGKFGGAELKGKVVVLYGLGNIGARVAKACQNLNMRVIVIIREKDDLQAYVEEKLMLNNGVESECLYAQAAKRDGKGVKVAAKAELPKERQVLITPDADGALPLADFVSFHIGAQKSGPVANAEFIKKVKKGCMLINTDRGALVDEKAVLADLKLEDGQLKCYHADFAPVDLELRKHKKCFSSCHTAASTKGAMANCAKMITESILAYMYDGNVTNSKNFPNVAFDRNGLTRVSVATLGKDVHDEVMKVLKEKNLTIIDSRNVNNGTVNYCLFDIKEKAEGLDLNKFGKARIMYTNEKYEELKKANKPKQVFNFFAGPATLPKMVLDGLKSWVEDWEGLGISLACMSHRHKTVDAMFKDTVARMRKLLKVPDNYEILFIQGGATLQFSMIPMNLSTKDGKIAMTETGTWTVKAVADAKKLNKVGFGAPEVLFTSKPEGFKSLPAIKDIEAKATKEYDYCHICWNETIHGLEYHELPNTECPLIVDASSNIMSRVIPWETKNIGMVFGGVQKNSGIAGSSFVIIRKDLVKKNELPAYLTYTSHVSKESMWNTPAVLTVASVNLMMKWVEKMGGVEEMSKLADFKSSLLYDFWDNSNGYYIPRAKKENRSRMNCVFNMKDPSLEKKLIAEGSARGLFGIGGHRSIGGGRISIYNGMPIEGVKAAVDFMREFMEKNPIQ